MPVSAGWPAKSPRRYRLPELARLLTGQLGLLWQAAVKQASTETLAAREQADDDIARADQERDEALAKVATLESKLAVLRELRTEALPLREQVARLSATCEHLATQLKGAREENHTLQAGLLTLARAEPKGGKVTKCPLRSGVVSTPSAMPLVPGTSTRSIAWAAIVLEIGAMVAVWSFLLTHPQVPARLLLGDRGRDFSRDSRAKLTNDEINEGSVWI